MSAKRKLAQDISRVVNGFNHEKFRYLLLLALLMLASLPSQGALVRVGACDTPGHPYVVSVAGSYACVADGSAGLQIIDISNPAGPTIKGACDTPDSAEGVSVAGSYAYVADGSAGLQIIDISNPAGPTIKGACDTPGYACGVAVDGSYAYVADGYYVLQIIDISSPAGPTIKGAYDTLYYYACDVAVAGSYAYLVDIESGLLIIDVIKPDDPTRVGAYYSVAACCVTVAGSYAYVGDYYSGLQIIAEAATISGKAWDDLNADGIQDDGEPGLPNVQVDLLDADGNSLTSTQTGTDGSYSFTVIPSRQYKVKFTPLAGKVFSPKDQGGDDTKDSDADPTTGATYCMTDIITTTPGGSYTGEDAGLCKPSISGTVYWDKNGNGVKDSGEPPLSGTVHINPAPSTGPNQIITDATDGTYSFTGLTLGTSYTVTADPMNGYSLTQPSGGSYAVNDINSAVTVKDFGYHKTTLVVDNRPGVTADYTTIQAAVNDAISGDTIQVYGGGSDYSTFNAPSTKVNLIFQGMGSTAPSVSGKIYLQGDGCTLSGFKIIGPKDDDMTGDLAALTISNSNTISGNTIEGIIYISGGANNYINDNPSITGILIWGNTNTVLRNTIDGSGVWIIGSGTGNQIKDNPSIKGPVAVMIGSDSNTVSGNTIEGIGADNGGVLISGSNNQITNNPSIKGTNFAISIGSASTSNTVSGNTLESIGDNSGGVVISGTGNQITNNPSIKGDYAIYIKSDSNTVSDNTIEGIGGSHDYGIYIYSGTSNQITNNPSIKGSTAIKITTGSNTIYHNSFLGQTDSASGNTWTESYTYTYNGVTRNLQVGNYWSVYAGSDADIDGIGDDAYQQDPSPIMNTFIGCAFQDLDGDGVKDGNEPGIGGLTITLSDGETATTSSTPGMEGQYSFHNLAPGPYTVSMTSPAGYAATTPLSKTDSIVGKADGTGSIVTDFGFKGTLSISGKVWSDVSADGVQQSFEPGLGGWEVRLFLDTAVISTTQTSTQAGHEGEYSFDNLLPGTYVVAVTLPPNSDWWPTEPEYDWQYGGAYRDITLTDSNSGGNDFGNVWEYTVYGEVFDDKDGDGVQDTGEPGLQGRTVRLTDARSGAEISTFITDSGGYYYFDGLGGEHDYILTEDLPSGRALFGFEISGMSEPGRIRYGSGASCDHEAFQPGDTSVMFFVMQDTAAVDMAEGTGTGFITITKSASPQQGSPEFSFVSTELGYPSGQPLILKDDPADPSQGTKTVDNLQPGSYTIQEIPAQGWAINDISVSNPGTSVVTYSNDGTSWHSGYRSASDSQPGDDRVKIVLAAGDTPSVAFSNFMQGSIKLTKVETGGIGEVEFETTGFEAGSDLESPVVLCSDTQSTGSKTASNLMPGRVYTIGEPSSPCWSLTGITVTGATTSAIEGSIDGGGSDPYHTGVHLEDRYVRITLGAGEDLEVIYDNTNTATKITDQPETQRVCLLGRAQFDVSATGSGDLTYQWQKEDEGGQFVDVADEQDHISGAATATLVIDPVASDDAGSYQVVVTGGCGQVTSDSADLNLKASTAIVTPPEDKVICAGSEASFHVEAQGEGTLSYKWQKADVHFQFNDVTDENNHISGATTDTLTITNAVEGDDSNYRVVVTGDCDQVVSDEVWLNVNVPVSIYAQPDPADQVVCEGDLITYCVGADGTIDEYQWQKKDSNGDFQDIPGETSSDITIDTTGGAGSGDYRVLVIGPCNPDGLASDEVSLIVSAAPSIDNQPSDAVVCAGSTATFSVEASGTNLQYQWQLSADGGQTFNDIPGATASFYTTPALAAKDDGNQYWVIVSNDWCGEDSSDVATLTVNIPVSIDTQPDPSDQTVCAGTQVIYSVTTSGTITSYQWQKKDSNGDFQDIAEKTSPSLTIDTTGGTGSGDYRVLVIGPCNPAGLASDPVHLVISTTTAITSQPSSQHVCPGGQAVFSVTAIGEGTLTYQWQKDRTDITGAESATLTISNVAAGDAGSYQVIVTGGCGQVTSNLVDLNLKAPTTIITQPISQEVCLGGQAAFHIVASGEGTPSYRWQKADQGGQFADINNENDHISGTTTDTLTITHVAAGDAGSYRAVVTGECGQATSSSAGLALKASTIITLQPTSQQVCSDSQASFHVTAIGEGTITYQWQKEGQGGQFADIIDDPGHIAGAETDTLIINHPASEDAGNYRALVTGGCGQVASDPALLTVNILVSIDVQPGPADRAVCVGTHVTYSVAASGTVTGYQWQKKDQNGDFQDIAGKTSSSLTIDTAGGAGAGDYRVLVIGPCNPDGLASNTVHLAMLTTTVITTQPSNEAVHAGDQASFEVAADGENLQYRWQKMDQNGQFVDVNDDQNHISGSATSRLTIDPAREDDVGDYRVVVTGACGQAISDPARLTVDQSADLSITKTGPASANAGEEIDYTLTVTNDGPSSVSDAVLSDVYSSLLSDVKYSINGGAFTGYISGSAITLPTMTEGQSATVHIKGFIGSSVPDGTDLADTASVSSSIFDPDTDHNQASMTTVIRRRSDVAITASGQPDPVIAGTRVTYTLTVTNNGPSNVAGAVAAFTLQPGLLFDPSGSTTGCTYDPTTNTVTFSFSGDLAVNDPRVITIAALVPATTQVGSVLTNTACVEHTEGGDTVQKCAEVKTTVESLSLSGRVWNDLDGDGQDDGAATEPGLSGWTVELKKKSSGQAIATATTGQDGSYLFQGVVPGDYTLTEILKSGWLQTAPEEGSHAVALTDSSVDSLDFGNRNLVDALVAVLTVEPSLTIPGSRVTLTGTVTQTGGAVVDTVDVKITLPAGLGYVSADPAPDDVINNADGSTTLVWNDHPFSTASTVVVVVANVASTYRGTLQIDMAVQGTSKTAFIESASASTTLKVLPAEVQIIKTAGTDTVVPGGTVSYNITYWNPGEIQLTDVVITDNYPAGMTFVSASPLPDAGTDNRWTVGTLPVGASGRINVLLQAPESQNLTFIGQESAKGTGFVNIYRGTNTGQGAVSLTNVATLSCAEVGTISSSASVRVDDRGTILKQTEHGSGPYSREELTEVLTGNKTIRVNSSLSARHAPTSFRLPHGQSISFSSMWSEADLARNERTGASLRERYMYASSIDKEGSILMDENGSTLATDTHFQGYGHLGALKKSGPDAGPKASPVFEGRESYSGSFHLNETIEEYGSNVISNKSAFGSGFVASDKRVRSSQRTYEYGSGEYQSEEMIRTPESYIAKDITAVYSPAGSSKWKEGVWSRNKGESFIGEEISSADYLKKETIAGGLNDIQSNASYSGRGVFRAALKDQVDLAEEYTGQYQIMRKVHLTGVSRYDTPHMTLTKSGSMVPNTTVVRYTITVLNDGNRALGPVYVRDLFPSGTQYVNSSVKPTKLGSNLANWTFMYMSIGQSLNIDLDLNVTEQKDMLVNRVYATAYYDDQTVAASNFSVLEFAWLPCCQQELLATKTAEIDSSDPGIIWYRLEVKNRQNYTMAARVTDILPSGLIFLDSSVQPESDPYNLSWVLTDIAPGETAFIDYRAQALRNGRFENNAHVDAFAVDGSGSASADVSATVVVGGVTVGRKAHESDWQPPDWELDLSENICGADSEGSPACVTCTSCVPEEVG